MRVMMSALRTRSSDEGQAGFVLDLAQTTSMGAS